MSHRSVVPAVLPHPEQSPYAWQTKSLCRGTDAETFFTEDCERGRPPPVSRTLEAKQLCRKCPVTQTCLQHALTLPETYGIWGGTTADERLTLLSTRPEH